MQVTRKALKQEKAHLKRMKKQRRALLSERQQALKAGFTADLKHREELTKQWVKSGVKGYVAAREALLRQHVQTQKRYEQRLANLDAAMRAQGRAISLLQRQDRLITDTLGGDVWDVPQLLTNSRPE
jgi:50S ribosomal subunit-associated GTPase HflX